MSTNLKENNFCQLKIKYWGERNYYSKICENNLIMQNVLRSCNNRFRSISNLSEEIGASAEYIKHAVSKLVDYGLMTHTEQGFCSNVPILLKNNVNLTEDISNKQQQLALIVKKFIDENYENIKEFNLFDINEDKNKEKWQICSILLYIGIMEKFQRTLEIIPPLNVLGDQGFVWAEEQYIGDMFGTVNICNMINESEDIIHFIEYDRLGESISNYFDYNHFEDILFEIACLGEVPIEHFSKRDIKDILSMNNINVLKYSNEKIASNVKVFDKARYQNFKFYLREITTEIAQQAENITDALYDSLIQQGGFKHNNQLRTLASLQMFNYVYAATFHLLVKSNYLLLDKINNINISFIILGK